jgi:Tfp pilus assembly protein PilO
MFVVAVAGGVAAYLFAIFLPGQRATADLRKQLIEQQSYVLDSTLLDAHIAQAEKDLARTKQFTQSWQEAAASEHRLAHVFLKITEHAAQSGAVMVLFEPQPAEHLAYLKKVPVQLALEGSFAQVFDFVARLETLEAEFWIDRMQIDPVPATKGKLRCEVHLVLFADRPKESD